MIQALQLAATVALAAVLLFAAAAKGRNPEQTRSDFDSLGLVGAGLLTRLVPAAETASAIALLLIPAIGGPVAFGLLVGFTVVLINAARMGAATGQQPSCACFGGTSSEPISARHIVRNGALMLLALVATTADWSLLTVLGLTALG